MSQIAALVIAPPAPWLLAPTQAAGVIVETACVLATAAPLTVVYPSGGNDVIAAGAVATVYGGTSTPFDRTAGTWLVVTVRASAALQVVREADLATVTGTFAVLARITRLSVETNPIAAGISSGGGGAPFQWVTVTASYTITSADITAGHGIAVQAATVASPAAPVLTAVAGTSPGAGAWTVGLTFVTPGGETTPGPTAALTVTGSQAVQVGAISSIPAVVTQVKYYMSTVVGTTTLGYVTVQTVASGAVPAIALTAAGSAGTLAPTANTSGNVIITLPTAVGVTQEVTIKRIDGTYPTNTVTIATTSAQTIDGATSAQLVAAGHSYVLGSDNANWKIAAGFFPNPITAHLQVGVGDANAVPVSSASGGPVGAAAGAQAGASPPAPVVTGTTDARGLITFGTGTGPAAGAQVVVTFTTALAIAPMVTIGARNAASADLTLYVSAVTTTTFTVSCRVAPAASQAATVYAVNYIVEA